jgi:hypothetical protein
MIMIETSPQNNNNRMNEDFQYFYKQGIRVDQPHWCSERTWQTQEMKDITSHHSCWHGMLAP